MYIDKRGEKRYIVIGVIRDGNTSHKHEYNIMFLIYVKFWLFVFIISCIQYSLSLAFYVLKSFILRMVYGYWTLDSERKQKTSST